MSSDVEEPIPGMVDSAGPVPQQWQRDAGATLERPSLQLQDVEGRVHKYEGLLSRKTKKAKLKNSWKKRWFRVIPGKNQALALNHSYLRNIFSYDAETCRLMNFFSCRSAPAESVQFISVQIHCLQQSLPAEADNHQNTLHKP